MASKAATTQARSGSDSSPRQPTLSFSIVSAVYNVDRYLDDFFASITSQTLDFRKHIELILVDDGSTDRSGKTIKRWLRKYPKNIRHVRQQNGGLSSARNRGLAEVSHEWVTFIDPDDFISPTYFERVGETIARHGADLIASISCNVVHYIEATRSENDGHPLRYRFAGGERAVPVADLGQDFQITVCGAFWRRDVIAADGLAFDERIRPASEDAHFSGRYFLRVPEKTLIFQPAATYFHRRRLDGSSLSQTGWQRPASYDDELRFAYLDLLHEARRGREGAPVFIQNMILYCLSWALTRAVDQPQSVSFLSGDQQRRYLELLDQVFSFIDAKTIESFSINLPMSHRIGILNRFKNSDPQRPTARVTNVDRDAGLIRLVYWSRRWEPTEVFRIDGAPIAPTYRKVRTIDLMGEPFVYEQIRWLPVGRDGTLHAEIDGVAARMEAGGARHDNGIPLRTIQSALSPPVLPEALLPPHVRDLRRVALAPEVSARYRDAWLFIDRDTEADDSAEHLYRFVRTHVPAINCFFILQRGSRHWTRLAAEGFRLLGFSEPEHALALLNAKFLISSQADHYVLRYLGHSMFGDRLKYKFVFLQHGVTQADYSEWFNELPIDRLITSTTREHRSIIEDGSRYALTAKETVLTGLPRHDALLAEPSSDAGLVLVMPTWRISLTGRAEGPGNARAKDARFYESEYAKRWKSLLHSPRLAAAAERAGSHVVFLPHPNLEQYIDYFDVPPAVEVRTFGDGQTIQPLFRSLSMFVTDYSSKAFDMAFLRKPIMYYQFDRQGIFSGGHTGTRGYFDFEKDGFGPIFQDEDSLVEALERFLNGHSPDPVYAQRAVDTFPFRDGKCCERVFEAIVSLGRPAGGRQE